MEYWSLAPLPVGDPGKEIAAPAKLRKPADEEMEFSSDSSVGSESEVEITGASGPPTSAAPEEEIFSLSNFCINFFKTFLPENDKNLQKNG